VGRHLLDLADELRQVVREEVARITQQAPSSWLNVKSAATYLDCSEDAIYGNRQARRVDTQPKL
jgi:hypothetical protein